MATLTTPALGSGVEGQARRLALQAFADHYLTLDGDLAAALERVEKGGAPQDFKDEYRRTLEVLTDCAASLVNS